jgi:hypothetical protein
MESPKQFVCKLSTPELQKRKATVIAELKEIVQNRNEFSNGISFEFKNTAAIRNKIDFFIKTEKLCCDFFIFEVTVEGSGILLKITGPEGAKEFLKEEINL